MKQRIIPAVVNVIYVPNCVTVVTEGMKVGAIDCTKCVGALGTVYQAI